MYYLSTRLFDFFQIDTIVTTCKLTEGTAVNIGRSIKIALAKSGKTPSWLAKELGFTRTYVSRLSGQEVANGATINKLSMVFGMKVSGFIALGESDTE